MNVTSLFIVMCLFMCYSVYTLYVTLQLRKSKQKIETLTNRLLAISLGPLPDEKEVYCGELLEEKKRLQQDYEELLKEKKSVEVELSQARAICAKSQEEKSKENLQEGGSFRVEVINNDGTLIPYTFKNDLQYSISVDNSVKTVSAKEAAFHWAKRHQNNGCKTSVSQVFPTV